MTIICWKDPATGASLWEEIPGAAEQALDQWQARHPNEKPLHQFIMPNDLLGDGDPCRRLFLARCGEYGLQPSDYNRNLYMPDNKRGILKGLQPGRRKYVFRVWDCGKQRYTLCTPALVKNGLKKWADAHQP